MCAILQEIWKKGNKNKKESFLLRHGTRRARGRSGEEQGKQVPCCVTSVRARTASE
jgi:hypothetical protein